MTMTTLILAQALSAGQIFEALMLICFGASWPFAILKTYRSKRVEGKSLAFLVLVILGYCAGMTAKFFRASADGSLQWAKLEWVTWLYAALTILVATDLVLVIRYKRRPPQKSA